MLKTIGIFGGTFDPVHIGHITLAQELKNDFQLDEMRLIPCRLPPHRCSPTTSDSDRLEMLQLAIANTLLTIDERELNREGASYTIDTLQSLRQEQGNDCALMLCMGMDAFARLNTWHRWQEILGLAHIVVVTRADFMETLNTILSDLLMKHRVNNPVDLKKHASGNIYLAHQSQISVSSTQIRKALAEGKTMGDALLPAVSQFIQQRGLYLTR